MPKKNPPTGTAADLNLATLSELFVDEGKARERRTARCAPIARRWKSTR